MNKLRVLFRSVAISSGLVLASLALYVQPVSAANTYVWNNRGTYVPQYGVPYTATVQHWIRNGTRVQMVCWVDNQWYTGNYGTNRWFWVLSFDGWYGYVHASYTINQVGVPRC